MKTWFFQSLHIAFCSSDSDLLAASFLPRCTMARSVPALQCLQIIRLVQDVRGAENDFRFPLLAGRARRHACKLDRGAESMSAKFRIAVIAGTSTGHFDGPGDEASLCTRILAAFPPASKIFSGPTFRAALPKKKCCLCGKAVLRA